MKRDTEHSAYHVVSPSGEQAIEARNLAPPLDTLNGKIVGEAWNGMFRGDKTFPRIRELLRKRYPEVKIIPYTELAPIDIVRLEESLEPLREALQQTGCDALIAGNGF